MKKIILSQLWVSILFITVSFGQTEKGSNLLSGNLNMNLAFQKGDNTSNLNLNFGYGHFIKKNFAIGISTPLYFSKFNAKSILISGIVPFMRYYFATSPRASLYASVNGGFIYQQNKPEYFNSSSSGYTAGMGFGYVFFLNESIGIENELRYDYNKQQDYSNFSTFSLNIGLQIYFHKSNHKKD